jgi:hypothetical protein
MPFPEIYDPTRNCPLMIALGRLVVRAAELDQEVGELLKRLCDPNTKKCVNRKSLRWKLEALKSIIHQIKNRHQILSELSQFCCDCLSHLEKRNSPVHSTYLIDPDGIVKWDSRRGPELIQPDDIEKDATELGRLTKRAARFNRQVRDLRQFEPGIIDGEYAPARGKPRPMRGEEVWRGRAGVTAARARRAGRVLTNCRRAAETRTGYRRPIW